MRLILLAFEFAIIWGLAYGATCNTRGCGNYNSAEVCQCDPQCLQYGDCCADYKSICSNPLPLNPADMCAARGCGNFDNTKSCQCDTQCSVYGDCCSDYNTMCKSSTTLNSCANRCNSFDATKPCQCDPLCSKFGNCCPDYSIKCPGTAPSLPSPPSPPLVPSPPAPTITSGTCNVGYVPLAGSCVKYAWTQAPNGGYPVLPIPLAEISAVTINGVIYLFGDGDLGSTNKQKTLGFNVAGKFWTPVNQLAQRPYPGDHTAVEVYNGELYAFAGLCCQQFCSGCGAESKVQIFNPSTNTWRLGTSIPWVADGAMSSALINGKIYVCGGMSNGWAYPKCGIYDPIKNSWGAMPDMCKAVHHTAAGTDGSKFYIFGGREGSNGLSDGQPDVQIYDPSTNSWTCSSSGVIKPLPTPRTGMGKAAYLGGEFYVMGGEWFPNQHPLVLPTGVFNLVEIYNPKTNTWRQGPPMPEGLHGLHPVVYNNTIYIAGGGNHIDRGTSTTFQVYGAV